MTKEVRSATWLELFYDLVFVVAIAKAVHALGHVHPRLQSRQKVRLPLLRGIP